MIVSCILLLALQITPELQRHIESGLRAKSAGDLDAAVQEFARVAELAPGLAAAHVNLGAVYLQKKDYAKAAVSLHQALELNPGLPGAHAMLGAALLAQGYAREAIPHLEKGQADDLLGVALLEADRARDAVDHLEAALGKRPGDPDLLYYLAQAHDRLAKQVFEQLRQSSPDSPRTHQALGEALAASGKTAEAEQHFRTALAARADYGTSIMRWASCIWNPAITQRRNPSSGLKRVYLRALPPCPTNWGWCLPISAARPRQSRNSGAPMRSSPAYPKRLSNSAKLSPPPAMPRLPNPFCKRRFRRCKRATWPPQPTSNSPTSITNSDERRMRIGR